MFFMKDLAYILQTLRLSDQQLDQISRGKVTKKFFLTHKNDNTFRFYWSLKEHCGMEFHALPDKRTGHFKMGVFKIHKDWIMNVEDNDLDGISKQKNEMMKSKLNGFIKYDLKEIDKLTIQFITRERMKMELTQIELAELVGISNDLISRYEKGRYPLRFSTIVSMLYNMKSSPQKLFEHIEKNHINAIDDIFKY